MDMQTIKDIGTIITLLIAIYTLLHNSGKDVAASAEKITENFTKLNWKMDAVCQSQTDIKDDIRELKKNSTDTDKRLSVVEEQIKVANHRISDLEGRNKE